MPECYIVLDARYKDHLTGPGHPERSGRYDAVVASLEGHGLLNEENILKPTLAGDGEILLCHTEAYLEIVKQEVALAREYGIEDGRYTIRTGDAQLCPASLEVARLAAGAGIVAVDTIFQGKAKRVFCPVRPPGHHAESNRGMGFCLFNNVAIAARYAQEKYGVSRVLIADFDVHHGNGTEEIFQEDPLVFYFSTHRALFYPPGTGLAKDKGTGDGYGTTVNVPIEACAFSREEVVKAFENTLASAMEDFKPEFVIISAGFDAHILDLLGGFNLEDEDFEVLTNILVDIANTYSEGRILSVLEGGYCLEALASAASRHVRALTEEA